MPSCAGIFVRIFLPKPRNARVGLDQNTSNPVWLADAGVGGLIALDRAAFSPLLHDGYCVATEAQRGLSAQIFHPL